MNEQTPSNDSIPEDGSKPGGEVEGAATVARELLKGQDISPEAMESAVRTLASEFHEDWRKTRLNEDGSFEPREKQTTDGDWIKGHGTNVVDIANTSYDDLPSDWQAENKAAADVVVGIMVEHGGKIDLSDEEMRDQVGDTVHQAWLSRNEWAKGGDLDKPFADLPEDEQLKDLSQVQIALGLFS